MSMQIKIVNIQTIAQDIQNHEADFGFKDPQGVVLILGSTVVPELLQRYAGFSFLYNEESMSDFAYFKQMYDDYVANNYEEILNYYQAYMVPHNTLEEYTRTEKTKYKNTRDFDHGDTVTTSFTNYTTKVTTGEYGESGAADTPYKTDYSSTTYDQTSNPKLKDRTEELGTKTTELDGSIKNAHSGTDTITDTRLDTDNVITVTGTNSAASDLIKAELELYRDYPSPEEFLIDRFGRRYLFLEV